MSQLLICNRRIEYRTIRIDPTTIQFLSGMRRHRLDEKRRRADKPEVEVSVGGAFNAEAHGIGVINLAKARSLRSACKSADRRVKETSRVKKVIS